MGRELRPLGGGGRESGAKAPLRLETRLNNSYRQADTGEADEISLATVVVVVACSSLRWQLCRAEKIGVKLEGITTCAWQERANGEAARLLSRSLSRLGHIRARGELWGLSPQTQRPR